MLDWRNNQLVGHQSHGTQKRPILVFITYSGFGDLISALPMLLSLRTHFVVLPLIQPNHETLAKLMHRDHLLDNYIRVGHGIKFRGNPLGYLKLCRFLSELEPDVILIYGKKLLALAARLGLFRAGRILFCIPGGNLHRRLQVGEMVLPTGNQAQDYLQFAELLGADTAPHDIRFSEDLTEELKKLVVEKIKFPAYAAIAPWSSDRRKDAPTGFYKQCMETIIEEGLPVVVTGLREYRRSAARLVRKFPGKWVVNLVGSTSTEELLGVLAGARFLLTNDSGNLHMAGLVGTPAIVAFGPTGVEQIASRQLLQKTVLVQLGLSCSPCKNTPHYYRCPGAYRACLTGLTADYARDVLVEACRSSTGMET